MSRGRAADAVKAARQKTGMTQQQLSFEIYESRESVSHQENGRYRVQPNISKYFAEKHNNPWVALEAAAEYTGWGPVKLDGDVVDLHRASVTMKTREELVEALEAIESVCVANHPRYIREFDKQRLEEAMMQAIDAIVALTQYVAVICMDYGFSWWKMWQKHRAKLQAKGFIRQ
ncbi:helix-turn-helix domain-containing protein [Geobacillus subterraneus]|uniref:helix-turn-helix domain-containing protein n=1 Tax=Geobacillus subterraneus TaxID=129338 RepID=UPI001442CB9F|nr:helix-turn-helix transcriptional regulator [Geobacillus subterraneus]QIZ66667.1 helix-turn-helix transcriptional regulator [Geobacillus subterraneus]